MIVSYLFVWAIFALNPQRPLAKPASSTDQPEEGSGYDVTDPFYDLESDDDALFNENVNYDGGGSYLNYEDNYVTAEPEEQKIIKCFHCLGDGSTGCDVIAMISNPDKYTISCQGRCLNISAGAIAVYDCARDLTVEADDCFVNQNTRMCFCSGDLCNRPNPAMSLLAAFQPLFNLNTPLPPPSSSKPPTDFSKLTPFFSFNMTEFNSTLIHLREITNRNKTSAGTLGEVTDDNSNNDNNYTSSDIPSILDNDSGDYKDGDGPNPFATYMGEEINIIIPGEPPTGAPGDNASSLNSHVGFDPNAKQAERIQSLTVGSSREHTNYSPSLASPNNIVLSLAVSHALVLFHSLGDRLLRTCL